MDACTFIICSKAWNGKYTSEILQRSWGKQKQTDKHKNKVYIFGEVEQHEN